jgi:hypothetical protein
MHRIRTSWDRCFRVRPFPVPKLLGVVIRVLWSIWGMQWSQERPNPGSSCSAFGNDRTRDSRSVPGFGACLFLISSAVCKTRFFIEWNHCQYDHLATNRRFIQEGKSETSGVAYFPRTPFVPSWAYSSKTYHFIQKVRCQRWDLVYLVENFFLIKTYIFKNFALIRSLKQNQNTFTSKMTPFPYFPYKNDFFYIIF